MNQQSRSPWNQLAWAGNIEHWYVAVCGRREEKLKFCSYDSVRLRIWNCSGAEAFVWRLQRSREKTRLSEREGDNKQEVNTISHLESCLFWFPHEVESESILPERRLVTCLYMPSTLVRYNLYVYYKSTYAGENIRGWLI